MDMRRFSSFVVLACILVIATGIGIITLSLYRRNPMICRVSGFYNGVYKEKTVLCLQYPHVRQIKPEKYSTETPTEIVYPTLTETEFNPWTTPTRTSTPEPYPEQETSIPYP